MIRINKYLSMCGVTSRRGAETLIKEGKVTINDTTIEKVGVIVDETTDIVKVDGTRVVPARDEIYIVLNKPRMVMTTLHDPFKRKTVVQYLKALSHRVYPVGRLDYDTEGVLLLTNDGELAYRLAHPRYQVRKVYEARVQGHFSKRSAEKIRAGVELEDGSTGKAEQVKILGYLSNKTRVRLILTEGRKREVKQLCKSVGHPVEHLVRVEFAEISRKNLEPGRWRYLTAGEVANLKRSVGL